MNEPSLLAEALAAFQAEMPTVAKANTADVPTKNGGSYSYSYADLADVSAAAIPLLTKNGLSFSCLPRRCEDGSYELAGTLLHTSGESLEGSLPIFGRTAQEIGSALTYGRRYLLGCMTGIVTDADDDGQAAQGAHQTRGSGGSSRPATEAQVKFMGTLMDKLGFDEPGRVRFVNETLGREVAGPADLSSRDASTVIENLKEQESADPWGQP